MAVSLTDKLKSLSESDIYPFHMPGHKRMMETDSFNPYKIDITEIDGFDNLHDPKGILKDEQEKAAAVYGSKQCYYLVNGSTCGVLAAICASICREDRVLVARNSHKSVYHAVELMQLVPEYVYPIKTRFGLQGHINPEDIEKKLEEYTDIKAVIVTSPTYDGIVSDIERIAKIVHEKEIPLIIDEAHGAHLGFHPEFHENATRLGADAVIMSLHKTLPAYTQTALLHICSDRIDRAKIERYLDIFETSSPSYLLMDGISRCVDMLANPSIYQQFDLYVKNITHFYEQAENLSCLKILRAESFARSEAFAFDMGKIIIYTQGFMTGIELNDILLKKYHLQLEMAGLDYSLAMTGFMDTEEGFERLAGALLDIDREILGGAPSLHISNGKSGSGEDNSACNRCQKPDNGEDDSACNGCWKPDSGEDNSACNGCRKSDSGEDNSSCDNSQKSCGVIKSNPTLCTDNIYAGQKKCLELSEARDTLKEKLLLENAQDKICGTYVSIYPPGIPILVPGEEISRQSIFCIKQCIRLGYAVGGIENDMIEVCKI